MTPDFVARVWLGNDYAGDHAFKGRTTDYFQIDIPMKDVATHDKQDLTIQKDGKGRLYYRVGMTYAPAILKLDAGGLRLRRRAALRGGRRSEATSRATPTARGTSRRARACA